MEDDAIARVIREGGGFKAKKKCEVFSLIGKSVVC